MSKLFFFTELVNVQSTLAAIHNLLSQTAPHGRAHSFGDESTIRSLHHHLKDLHHYLGYTRKEHVLSMHPEESARIERAQGMIPSLQALITGKEREELRVGQFQRQLQLLERSLATNFNLSTVYLLRHPEKVKPHDVKEGRKNLSLRGVRQAKEFAEYLAEEILLCPKPVRVTLWCSDMHRTFLFAEIIRRKLVQSTHFYHKQVRFDHVQQHPALAFRFQGDAAKPMEEDYVKDEWGTFIKWTEGHYPGIPSARQVAAEIQAFATVPLRENSADEWHITIGVSHSYIIDAFLFFKLPTHTHIIDTAGYIRFVGNQLAYKGRWYRL